MHGIAARSFDLEGDNEDSKKDNSEMHEIIDVLPDQKYLSLMIQYLQFVIGEHAAAFWYETRTVVTWCGGRFQK